VQTFLLLSQCVGVYGIIGGHPSHASVVLIGATGSDLRCTGIIVDAMHVLSTANCFHTGLQNFPTWVSTGVSPLSIPVARFFFHPCHQGFNADLVLLRLTSRLPSLASMPLANSNNFRMVVNDTTATMTGFDNRTYQSAAEINVVDLARCISSEVMDVSGITASDHLCVGGAMPSVTTWAFACPGDYGGPVSIRGIVVAMLITNTRFPLFGESSCTTPGRLTYATLVAPYATWIDAVTHDAAYIACVHTGVDRGITARPLYPATSGASYNLTSPRLSLLVTLGCLLYMLRSILSSEIR
jgi:hypothetical protein